MPAVRSEVQLCLPQAAAVVSDIHDLSGRGWIHGHGMPVILIYEKCSNWPDGAKKPTGTRLRLPAVGMMHVVTGHGALVHGLNISMI